MIPTCYCQDLQASVLGICSMYLFTQPIFLPHYFPVCLRRGCLFSLLLSLPVSLSPSLLLSLKHPHPPHSFAQTLFLRRTRAHTNTHGGTFCASPDQSIWLQYCLQKTSFNSPSLDHTSKPRLFIAGIQTVLEFFTHPGFIMKWRSFLISIIFAAAVQGNISGSGVQASSSEESHLPSSRDRPVYRAPYEAAQPIWTKGYRRG